MKYQKPIIYSLDGVFCLHAYAQYIVNTTDERCHGAVCGHPQSQSLANGSDILLDGCSPISAGDFVNLKCLETGNQIYKETFLSVTPGGSASCPPGGTPMVYHIIFEPTLPQICTITSEVYKGVDFCTRSCSGSGGNDAVCGDASCNGDENCNTCPDDCGSCLGNCVDAVKNGSETDVDCGGLCAACAPGLQCAVDADCTSNVCTSLVCQAPNCSDFTKNGNETDVDCGGGSCSPCNVGKECLVDSDCYNAYCSGGYCTPY